MLKLPQDTIDRLLDHCHSATQKVHRQSLPDEHPIHSSRRIDSHSFAVLTMGDLRAILKAIMEQKEESRFFLDQDDSSHWYIVPCDKSDEWVAWRDLPEDDENGWDHPEWVTPVDSPGNVSFTNPTED